MKKLLSLVLVVFMLLGVVAVASAADFVKSAEAKSAPEVKAVVIKKADGTVETPSFDTTVDAVSLVSATGDAKATLESSLKELKEAKNVSDLCADVKDKNLEVADLFDVAPSAEILAYLADNEGAKVEVKFTSSNEKAPVVMYKCDGASEWKAVKAEDVKVNADGTVSVNFSEFCNVAFLYASATPAPEKGPSYLWLIIVLVLILVIVAVICYSNSKKKAAKEEKPAEEVKAEEEVKEEVVAEEVAAEEAPAEEAVAEETVEEAPVEEAPAEETVEEAPVEEAPAEEAKAEDAE